MALQWGDSNPQTHSFQWCEEEELTYEYVTESNSDGIFNYSDAWNNSWIDDVD